MCSSNSVVGAVWFMQIGSSNLVIRAVNSSDTVQQATAIKCRSILHDSVVGVIHKVQVNIAR